MSDIPPISDTTLDWITKDCLKETQRDKIQLVFRCKWCADLTPPMGNFDNCWPVNHPKEFDLYPQCKLCLQTYHSLVYMIDHLCYDHEDHPDDLELTDEQLDFLHDKINAATTLLDKAKTPNLMHEFLNWGTSVGLQPEYPADEVEPEDMEQLEQPEQQNQDDDMV